MQLGECRRLGKSDKEWFCGGCLLPNTLSENTGDSGLSGYGDMHGLESGREVTPTLYWHHWNVTWWIRNSEAEIHGCMILSRDRNREGDGVCVYIRREIAFNARNDTGGDLETIWTEVYLPKTKPILVGVCYRPPKQLAFFSLLAWHVNNFQIQNVYYWVILIQIINKLTPKQTNLQYL